MEETAVLTAESHCANAPEAAHPHAAAHARRQEKHPRIGLNVPKLFWVFAVMSFAGLAFESIQHVFAFGEWESRAGLVWGPFSPIYGLGALLLTVLLEPLMGRHVGIIFLVGAVVGGVVEYYTSWAMETFWGVVAWSYLEIPLNFDGRTDVFHCIAWGILSVAWIKLGLPLMQKTFARINTKHLAYKLLSGALIVFMALNIFITVSAMFRADDRTHGVAAQTAFEEFLDENYPNERLQSRFENMGGIGRAD